MKSLLSLVFVFAIVIRADCQQQKLWTEKDRSYLLENLTRSRDQLIKETGGLTNKQWNFKESTDRWSIRQVVEHIDIWELLLQREINLAYDGGPKPDMVSNAAPDSVIFNFLKEDKQHIATEYTKPFTFSVPMGLNEGKTNMAWFLKMRNESIDFIKNANEDLRLYFGRPRRSIHYVYLSTIGHADRHLKQIQKIKTHPNYPK